MRAQLSLSGLRRLSWLCVWWWRRGGGDEATTWRVAVDGSVYVVVNMCCGGAVECV